MKEKYGDARRTEIVGAVADIDIEELIKEEDMVVTISHGGYIKRNAVSLYRAQRRGGKGKMAATTKEDDFVESLFVASTHSYILFFTNKGRIYWLKVHELPQMGRAARGKAIVNLLRLEQDETVAAHLPVREFTEGSYVIVATTKGLVKKTSLMAYSNPRKGGIIGLVLEKGDELIAARLTDGQQHVFLASASGLSIRFKETRRAPHGTRLARGEGNVARQGRPRGQHGDVELPGEPAHGLREGLRQADADRRVPGAEPGREGNHHDQDHRAQRPGEGREARDRRRRSDDHHEPRQDRPHQRARHLGDRPQHAGRPARQSRGGTRR